MVPAGRSFCAALISISLSASAQAADFPAALACAAMLMGQPVPTRQIETTIIPATMIQKMCQGPCVAFYWPIGDGALVGFTPAASKRFDYVVHEACHVVQHESGRIFRGPKAEAECHRVQNRARLCQN